MILGHQCVPDLIKRVFLAASCPLWELTHITAKRLHASQGSDCSYSGSQCHLGHLLKLPWYMRVGFVPIPPACTCQGHDRVIRLREMLWYVDPGGGYLSYGETVTAKASRTWSFADSRRWISSWYKLYRVEIGQFCWMIVGNIRQSKSRNKYFVLTSTSMRYLAFFPRQ